MTSAAICDGGAAFLARRVAMCPTENRRRRMVTRSQVWYGTEWHCLGCGDSWADGDRGYRPFERGWRPRAIARHRALWSQVAYAPGQRRQALAAWLMAELAP